MHRFVVLVGLVVVLSSGATAVPKCHFDELMSCLYLVRDFMDTLEDRNIVTTADRLDELCGALTAGLNCVLDFKNRCMTPMQKEVVDLLIEGTVDLHSGFCSEGNDGKKNWLKHAPCLNTISRSPELRDELEYLLATIEGVDKVEMSQKITYACCGFKKVYNWFVKKGNDECGAEATNMVLDLIKTAFAQLPGVVCSGFEGTEEKCVAVLLPNGSKPTEAAKSSAIYAFIKRFGKNWLQ